MQGSFRHSFAGGEEPTVTTRHLECTDGMPVFLMCVVFFCSTKHADSIDLELEVDPLNVDHFSCTPLVNNQCFCVHVAFNPFLYACVFLTVVFFGLP